ncbi:hypothetical protein EWM64_g9089 [Hericium alpestre]|uniref:Uncharacterized protein n=1 Tax=Hericium alpestre TaxID=135208 RepID=A0A4Y9ZLT6_9AGAM|nr:hypothetical protein EWM64_g9089 [Hericium alpestre]
MRIMPCPPASEEPAGPSKATAYKRRDSHDVSDKSRGKRRCITRVGSEAEEDVKPNLEDAEDDSHIKLLQENLKKMQDELNDLLTAKSGSIRVKAERAPSPIRVGSAAGEVIDLTED